MSYLNFLRDNVNQHKVKERLLEIKQDNAFKELGLIARELKLELNQRLKEIDFKLNILGIERKEAQLEDRERAFALEKMVFQCKSELEVIMNSFNSETDKLKEGFRKTYQDFHDDVYEWTIEKSETLGKMKLLLNDHEHKMQVNSLKMESITKELEISKGNFKFEQQKKLEEFRTSVLNFELGKSQYTSKLKELLHKINDSANDSIIRIKTEQNRLDVKKGSIEQLELKNKVKTNGTIDVLRNKINLLTQQNASLKTTKANKESELKSKIAEIRNTANHNRLEALSSSRELKENKEYIRNQFKKRPSLRFVNK